MTQQFLEQDAMKRAPHPAYPPNLAPSDFSLFGYVKQLLAGQEFFDGEALLGAISTILGGIEKVTLESVFLGWDGEALQMYRHQWRARRRSYLFTSIELHDLRPVSRCSWVSGHRTNNGGIPHMKSFSNLANCSYSISEPIVIGPGLELL
jgi:hypothetical protein